MTVIKRNTLFVAALIFAFGLGLAMRWTGEAGRRLVNALQPPKASAAQNPKSKHTNSLAFAGLSASAQVDLSDVTFKFRGLPSHSASVGAQLYLHRGVGSEWDLVSATASPSGEGGAVVFSVFRHIPATLQFTAALKPGTYDDYRLLLFPSPDGKSVDYGHTVYDTASDDPAKKTKLSFTVRSTAERITEPQLVYAPQPDVRPDGSGSYTATIPAKLELPSGYSGEGGGLWVMAKGSGGFSQQWATFASAQPDGAAGDKFESVPIKFELKSLKTGLWNVQFGVFKLSWGDPLQWVYPGLDFEVGGDAWEVKSPSRPPRVSCRAGRFVLAGAGNKPASLYSDDPRALSAVSFVRGGNYGNAITWTMQPALDTAGYFALLGDAGCRFVRFNYDADKYLSQPVYRHSVDQVVQNIWQAGEYPLIAPQDLPTGAALAERVSAGEKVLQLVAERYKGEPVWIEECNEPHEFATWAAWKPIAERYAKAIRAVDSGAFVVAPFESYCKDGRSAAKSPILDTHVDLYDGHAYVAPGEINQLFGPDAKAGLPLLLGEFGGSDPAYLKSMLLAMQAMRPAPVAIAPWAFTVKGQDSLPLVESSSGASIEYTPAGQVVADDYSDWLGGKRAEPN